MIKCLFILISCRLVSYLLKPHFGYYLSNTQKLRFLGPGRKFKQHFASNLVRNQEGTGIKNEIWRLIEVR